MEFLKQENVKINLLISFMCGSCRLDKALNVEIGVEF